MDHPEGAGSQRADRVDFDPGVRLEFRGTQVVNAVLRVTGCDGLEGGLEIGERLDAIELGCLDQGRGTRSITATYTAASIARGYVIRRLFAKMA